MITNKLPESFYVVVDSRENCEIIQLILFSHGIYWACGSDKVQPYKNEFFHVWFSELRNRVVITTTNHPPDGSKYMDIEELINEY